MTELHSIGKDSLTLLQTNHKIRHAGMRVMCRWHLVYVYYI